MVEVPTWDHFMIPMLKLLAERGRMRNRMLGEEAADAMGLSAEARAERIPSGALRYLYRANWAVHNLLNAGAIRRPERGVYELTDFGSSLLRGQSGHLRWRDVVEAIKADDRPDVGEIAPGETPSVASGLTPEEMIDEAAERIHADVAADLLRRLHDREPAFFEQAVLDLIMAMGYGGAEGKATRTQLSNDGGIDGVVDQDALGLSRVYVQAKRYELGATVGRPAIQAFVGALHGQQANQGVFFTTARYSVDAIRYAEGVSTRVVLIDGVRLASLMIRYGVGVQTKRTVAIVEVDEDFFE